MNHYLVKLTLFLGEYEKTAVHLVQAKNTVTAGRKALLGECHNDPKRSDWAGDSQVDDDCFAYRVNTVTKVTAEHAAVLAMYL
jgi:hypothetical protein